MNKRQRKKQMDRRADAALSNYSERLLWFVTRVSVLVLPRQAAQLMLRGRAFNVPFEARARFYRTAERLTQRVFAKMYHVVSLLLILAQAPECVKDRDCASGQKCVGGACKVRP